jgi:hypothetical protein
MPRSTLDIARGTALVVTLVCAAPSAGAQGAISAFVSLKGMAQGAFRGSATLAPYRGDIAPISLTTSEPYGAATPVLHIVTDAGVAPQVVRALVTSEVLAQPTIVFVKQNGSGALQPFYALKAQRGYITSATISAGTDRVPTVTFDLLLSGGTVATNETGGATTAPAPAFVGNAVMARGTVLTGEFTGVTAATFPPSPNAPRQMGILLDSVSMTFLAPVVNGATGGKAMARPLVIARPAGEDAALFDGARTQQETFSKIVLHVFEPASQGLVDGFDITLRGACLDVGNAGCSPASGLPTGQPGASAGLAASGGGTRGLAPAGVVPGRRLIGGDASATMLFLTPSVEIESRQTQTTVTHSFATNTTS